MRFINSYISLLREAYDDLISSLESETSQGFLIGLSVLTPIFGTLFFFTVLVNAAEHIVPEATAVVHLVQTSPDRLEIRLTDNTTPLNAAEMELLFDPQAFSVTDLTIQPGLCEERFIITKLIDNASGKVFYQCGTIMPFGKASTTLAILKIAPLSTGTSTVTFGTNTNVLAHDGYGSNVTKERVPGTFAYSL